MPIVMQARAYSCTPVNASSDTPIRPYVYFIVTERTHPSFGHCRSGSFASGVTFGLHQSRQQSMTI